MNMYKLLVRLGKAISEFQISLAKLFFILCPFLILFYIWLDFGDIYIGAPIAYLLIYPFANTFENKRYLSTAIYELLLPLVAVGLNALNIINLTTVAILVYLGGLIAVILIFKFFTREID